MTICNWWAVGGAFLVRSHYTTAEEEGAGWEGALSRCIYLGVYIYVFILCAHSRYILSRSWSFFILVVLDVFCQKIEHKSYYLQKESNARVSVAHQDKVNLTHQIR